MHNLLFFGTPDFAIPSLQALLESAQYRLVAVVTETDKPAGRGQKLQAPSVKRYALERGLVVLQPVSLKGVAPTSTTDPNDGDALRLREILAAGNIDAAITVAYGKIIPRRLLDAPRCGIINVHASLLPRWRGAAPIQRALLTGDTHTGVCIMQTEASLDTGPVFYQKAMAIHPSDTYGSLHDSLATLGAESLITALPQILSGVARATTQSSEGVTYAEKWTIEDAHITWSEEADALVRRIRASNPLPGARTSFAGQPIKIFAASRAPELAYSAAAPGTIVDVQRKRIIVACGEQQYIAPEEIQLSGRKRMPIAAAMQGYTFTVGEMFV
jgi:methionyl-tRNA formyltransferase